MNSFFTIANAAHVNLEDTTRLLFDHAAVWLPPMSIPPCGAIPQPGDPFWLLYLDGSQTRVLGGGPLALAPRTMGRALYRVLWNDADRPGLRAEAKRINYRGANNMTFVRLHPPTLYGLQFSQQVTLPNTWGLGLNLATAPQEAILRSVLSF